MKFVVKEIIGPYDGPHEKGITTIKLLTKRGIIAWHENGKRGFFNPVLEQTYNGLVVKTNKGKLIPNYKQSEIKETQYKLEL